METITETVRNVWDSLAGRILILGLTLGWVPFALLAAARDALTHR